MAPKWGVDLYTGSTYTRVNTVCSFFNQTSGYQSFYGALLTFNYFFTSRKSYVFWYVLARCFFWRPCRKSDISGSIWHESSIQMVKYSFPDKRIILFIEDSWIWTLSVSVCYPGNELHAELSAKMCSVYVCRSQTQNITEI